MAMKKIFLIGVAALLLGTGTAHAADALICGQEEGSCRPYREPVRPPQFHELPDYMQGRWCRSYETSTEAQQVYFPPNIHDPNRTTCGDLNDGIMINFGGYYSEEVSSGESCHFDKVFKRGENIFVVYATCIDTNAEKQDPIFIGQEEFQLANGLLFKKRMSQG